MENKSLFENLQMLEELEPMFEMSKLVPKRANKDRCGNLDVYIYFSAHKGNHGPRVKFDGGNKQTEITRDAPTMTFDINGEAEIKLQSWMNKKTCPNAFNKEIVNNVKSFIKKTLPILLLVWFRKLDESDALLYFQGHIEFKELLEEIIESDIETKEELLKSKDLNDLHDKCKRYLLYDF